jgi:sulfatase maturation enzyme AslB (radical SAM superfamily)
MDRLRAAGVPFSVISVLHRENVEYVEDICGFFQELKCSFRLLPIYRDAFGRSNDGRACSHGEVQDALVRVARWWLASNRSISIEPIAGFLQNIEHFMRGNERNEYSKCRDNRVFAIVCAERGANIPLNLHTYLQWMSR